MKVESFLIRKHILLILTQTGAQMNNRGQEIARHKDDFALNVTEKWPLTVYYLTILYNLLLVWGLMAVPLTNNAMLNRWIDELL